MDMVKLFIPGRSLYGIKLLGLVQMSRVTVMVMQWLRLLRGVTVYSQQFLLRCVSICEPFSNQLT